MNHFNRFLCCTLPIFAATLGITLPTRSQTRPLTKSTAALNAQQFAGEGLFLQNCALCHLPHKVEGESDVHSPDDNPKNTKVRPSIGPSLMNLFRGDSPVPDQVVRTFIRTGFPEKMPGFRYSLRPSQIDSIIAYLKTLSIQK